MVVRGEIVGDSDQIFVRKIVELSEKFCRICSKSDIGVDDDQPVQVDEDPVVEGQEVVDGVVVLVRKSHLDEENEKINKLTN